MKRSMIRIYESGGSSIYTVIRTNINELLASQSGSSNTALRGLPSLNSVLNNVPFFWPYYEFFVGRPHNLVFPPLVECLH
jgi:hypothetical protein